jgi:hypothetical protein
MAAGSRSESDTGGYLLRKHRVILISISMSGAARRVSKHPEHHEQLAGTLKENGMGSTKCVPLTRLSNPLSVRPQKA